jgi:sulfur-oxidizing protein SoxZ
MITGVSSPAPRDMLATFVARMNGEVVFSFDFKNGTSANPYVVFFVRLEETSAFDFVWTHENGTEFTSTGEIRVS